MDTIAKLQAENARLRVALKEIVELDDEMTDHRAQYIAREAITDEQKVMP